MTTTKMNLDPDKADALAQEMILKCLQEQPPNLLNHYAAALMASAALAVMAINVLSVPESRDINAGICIQMMEDMLAQLKQEIERGAATDVAPSHVH